MNPKSTYNHFLFSEAFYSEVKRRIQSTTHATKTMALLTFDLDNFNYINDFFGYDTGDITLTRLTEHFSALLQDDEIFSRIYSDHFLFCLNDDTAEDVLKRFLVLSDFKDMFSDILVSHCNLNVSAGCVFIRDDTSVLPSLLDNANYARKKAKGTPSSTLKFYNEKMNEDVRWQKLVCYLMESALDNKEFEMFLQPKVSLKTNQLVGAEALVRWRSPIYGLIYPDKFIPIMEQNGFIRQIDFFMLEEVCRFLKKTSEDGIPMLPISVNFSKAHLSTANLAEKVFRTVNRFGISTHLIEIEFTESLFVENFESLLQIITDLKSFGFKVSLDDFGNSYSSLSCLKYLPLDIIKIDKGFLSTTSDGGKGKVIISKIVELIKSLHMQAVIEGVETEEQQDFLQKTTCDIAQGFYYARPMKVDDYLEFMKRSSDNPAIQNDPPELAESPDNSNLISITHELEATNSLKLSLENKINELNATVESERKTKEALKLSEERYRIIMDQSDDIMFEWDFETDNIHFSNKYEHMFGFTPICDNLTTNPNIRKLIHPRDMIIFEQWIKNTYNRVGCSEAQYRIKASNDEYIWVRCRSTAICNEKGIPNKTIGVFTNINAQKNELDSLTVKSQCDPLTKLLNKTETQLRVEEILNGDFSLQSAFLIIDIDNFKGINDNLGHQLGDAVLTNISDKIRETFSTSDIIGRIGGDEIAVFMRNCTEEEVQEKATMLNERLHSTYYGSTTQYNISGSIGIALYPIHGDTFAELYHYADIALYESKNSGKDQFTIYNSCLAGSLVDNRTPVDWNNGFLDTYFKNDFPFKIFDILYETRDFSLSVDIILELLGKRYDVDRVYIFQRDTEGSGMSNTYEWCAPGITSEIEQLQHLPIEELGVYFTQYNQEGVYCCTDIQHADRPVYDLCAPQGIKSLLHCALYNERELTGFIGFDVCKDYHQWSGEEIASLGYIARILSVFLTKTHTESELRSMYRNYVEMLDNLNGFVYVIDPDTYQVLYVNNATKAFGWTPGQTCYKMAFGNSTPCKNCPINHFSDTVHYSVEEIYSDLLKGWVHSAASRLKWSSTQDAVLICCTDISKYKK